jgi:hypothetical protein
VTGDDIAVWHAARVIASTTTTRFGLRDGCANEAVDAATNDDDVEPVAPPSYASAAVARREGPRRHAGVGLARAPA